MQKLLRSLAFTLLLIFGVGLFSNNAKADTPTTVPTQPKQIQNVSINSTPAEVIYKSVFDMSTISLLVEYTDGTSAVMSPTTVTGIDTSVVGRQQASCTLAGYDKPVTCTISIVPRQITGLRIESATDDSATITWDKLEDNEYTSYQIFKSNKATGSFTYETSVKENQYKMEGLTQGEIVYVKVVAVHEKDGFGVAGSESVVKAIAPKPTKVSGVKAVGGTNKSISIKWTKNQTATAYAVYYRLESEKNYTLTGQTTDSKFNITGLSAGKSYFIVVRAIGGDISNLGPESDVCMFGTAPSVPKISIFKAGDKRIKAYYNASTGAEQYKFYISTDNEEYTQIGKALTTDPRIFVKDGLLQNIKYYFKIVASRTIAGIELSTSSTVVSGTTKESNLTNEDAKLFATFAKFKKSSAYKNYKAFSKYLVWKQSFILPGQKNTNVAGFDCTTMVPQSVIFAKNYILISAYDLKKNQESVIYILDKKTRKLLCTIVLPHKGHVGGMAYDGTNVWIAYGKNVQCIKFSVFDEAVKSGESYKEVFSFTTVIKTPITVSYLAYFKNKLWVGVYNELVKKYMYAYTISSKTKTPKLKNTNKMLMPNRTQGVAFTSKNQMIISRSCQTKKSRRGFMSQLEMYKPTWTMSKKTLKKNSCKVTTKMPPMNEGIAISGAYTYVIYESISFAECSSPLDRVMAFKTSNLVKIKKKKK